MSEEKKSISHEEIEAERLKKEFRNLKTSQLCNLRDFIKHKQNPESENIEASIVIDDIEAEIRRRNKEFAKGFYQVLEDLKKGLKQ